MKTYDRPTAPAPDAGRSTTLTRPLLRALSGLLPAMTLVLLAGSAAQAAPVTWSGLGASPFNWSDVNDWDITAVPGAADDAIFSTAGLVPDTSINNTVDASFFSPVLSLSYTNTSPLGSPLYHNTAIGDGLTLSISNTSSGNAVYVGAGSDTAGLSTLATISGPLGSLAVSASNGVFNVRQGGLGHFSGTASLDMSGLSNATITAQKVLVAGDGSNALDANGGRLADRPGGTLKLATHNTLNILAPSANNPPGLTLGYTVGNVSQVPADLELGQTNYIYSDSGLAVGMVRINFGRMVFNSSFAGMSPYAVFRNVAQTGRQSKWLIGDASLGTTVFGGTTGGTVDFTTASGGADGVLDAKVDQLVVGRSKNYSGETTGAGATGTLTYDAGTLDINTALIGYQMVDYCAAAVGTVNVGCTAQLFANSMTLGRFMGADSTNGQSQAILNINGGQVFVTNGITTVTSPLNPDNHSEINITSPGFPCSNGWLYVKGNVGPIYNLSLGSGTTITFDLGASFNPTTPVCTVSNLITAPTTTLVVQGSALDIGSFQVIKYGSYSMTDMSDFSTVLPATAFGYFTNNTATLSIDLVITNTATFSWNGRTNGVDVAFWDIGGTPDWKSGASQVVYSTSSNAQFDDSAQGTTAVNITTPIPTPTTIFKNTIKNYTLSGSGSITGSGGLSKSGTGTVTIANSGGNAFSGPVSISAGTVKIDVSSDRLPTATAVTLANTAGVTLDLNGQSQTIGSLAGGGAAGGEVKLGAGQLTVQNLASTVYNGLISGPGSLMVSNKTTGPGLNLLLSRNNTFAGGTTITNAAVIVTNTAASARTPLGTGPITIKGPASIPNPGSTTVGLWLGNGAGTVGYVSQPFITNGLCVSFKNGADMDFTNCIVNVSGGGAGTMYVAPVGNAPSGARVTISGTNYFTGRVQMDSGELRITTSQPWGNSSSASALVLGNTSQLELANNITNTRPISQAGPSGTSYPAVGIVNVSGTNTMAGLITGISGGSSWGYRSDAGKLIFRGNWTANVTGARYIWLQGAGEGEWIGNIGIGLVGGYANPLIKADTGTWTLAGSNYYAGFTAVSNGTLIVNGTLVVTNGTSGSTDTNVYVASGGTLRGTGSIITPPRTYILPGGTLAPGTAAAIGTLTIYSNLVLQSGSFSQFRVNDTGVPSNDAVRGLQSVAFDGTLNVTLGSGRLVGGEVFQLFSASSYSGQFAQTNLPGLPSPLGWDTTQLGSGRLIVTGTVSPKSIGVAASSYVPNGNFQMSGTSTLTNWNYRVLATTNLAASPIIWTQVGSGVFTLGAYSFTDANSGLYPQRFYKVVAP